MDQINQICRLCLTDCVTNNDTILVEIFSSLVNVEGKAMLIEKIFSTTGIKITKNDVKLPSKICHKCLVSIESFVEFRDKVRKSDQKLRLMLNIDSLNEGENESPVELDDFDEIIRLDPNKLYESSEDENEEVVAPLETVNQVTAIETPEIVQLPIVKPQQENIIPSNKISNTPSSPSKQRKNIFHCKYCDIVFSDQAACINHEAFNHDPQNPYECAICSFKFNQHQNLIIHIKAEHNSDKPFICVQCSKSFIRRSDLKKHIFVHAGIRMFSCNLCAKSFTRSTNLAKHKRTHQQQVTKSFKCTLCPQAFASTAELHNHMEIHMNRNTFNCKFCNQVFTLRDELDAHQKTHVVPVKVAPQIPMQPTTSSIVFYNKDPMEQEEIVPKHQAPMNFYTENVERAPPPLPPPVQSSRMEYPIMNQLLSNFFKCEKCFEQFPTLHLLQNHQTLYHTKNFTCSVCNSSYYKKKELDRHVISAHTDIRYNCSKCNKSFSRKDKLARHERTHMAPAFHNCPFCPAVFIRKNLLDLHSKIHMLPQPNHSLADGFSHSGQNSEDIIQLFQNANHNLTEVFPQKEEPNEVNRLNLEQHPAPQIPIQEASAINAPIPASPKSPLDLTTWEYRTDKLYMEGPQFYPRVKKQIPPVIDEPMDLMNECVKNDRIEQLQPGNNNHFETPHKYEINPKTEDLPANEESIKGLPNKTEQNEDCNKIEALSISMNSRLSDLDKLEPSQDLPMEILQSPGV